MDRTPSPPPRTPEAEAELQRFLAQYAEYQSRIERFPLTILVWGPDPSHDTPAARKRVEIRDALIRDGHNALFSEDVPRPAGTRLSLKTLELAQAQCADLIIVLYDRAPGSIAEVHDMSSRPELAHRLYVLAHASGRDGYGARGALRNLEDAYRAVYWYTDDDLAACSVCAHALRRAQGLRELRVHGGALA